MWRDAVPSLSRKSKMIVLKMAQACATGKLAIILVMGSIIGCNVMGAILMSEVCSKIELVWPHRTWGVGAGLVVMLPGIALLGYVFLRREELRLASWTTRRGRWRQRKSGWRRRSERI